MSEYLGDSEENSTLQSWMNNLEGFTEMIETVVEEGKTEDSDPEEVLDWFYTDGWEDMYGENGNFYKPAGKYYRLYKGLVRLGEEGYDVSQQWQEFGLLLDRIWKNLPEFYVSHPIDQKIDPPENYDPDKPFPELQIPEEYKKEGEG